MRVRQLRTEADVDQFHGSAPVRGQHVHRLQRAEGDRCAGDGRAVDGAGVGVDTAGRVDGQHRHRAGVRNVDQLGGRGAQRPAAGEADDAVEHEVRPSDRRGAVGPGGDGPAAGPAQRRQPAGVGPLRVEQHGGDPDAAAAQLRACPQGVAAVVACSYEKRDTMSVRRGQRPPGDDGEAERGAAHESARRHPHQHRPLGGAYLLDGEDLAHPATLGRREGHRDGDVIGVWSTWMSNLTSVPCTLVTVTVTP